MSNNITIYSPEGEMFENVTAANARDLVTHRNWTYERLVAAATPAAPAAPVAPAAPASTETTPPAAPVTEQTVSPIEAIEAAYTTAEQFAAITEKADMQAYLAKFFPDFKIDGRSPRDKLVAQAVELANGEQAEEA